LIIITISNKLHWNLIRNLAFLGLY
jgi:hypothetical protein